MKKYATVPLRLKFKRLWRAITRLSVRFTTDTSVGICRETGTEPEKTYRFGRDTELKLIDIAKLAAAFAAFWALAMLLAKIVLSIAVDIAAEKKVR